MNVALTRSEAEIPGFTLCHSPEEAAELAKTAEKARENYKKQLRLTLMLMLEDNEEIQEPGEDDEDDIDWENICPG